MSQHSEPNSIDYLLKQVCRLHYTRAHLLLEKLGLYRGQPPVLRALWGSEGLTHTDLAARLHVQPATITKMIQRMERAGFVERRPDEKDQRLSRVYLTEAGRGIRGEVHRVWRTLEGETFRGFSQKERALIGRFFDRMRENLMQVTGGDHRVR